MAAEKKASRRRKPSGARPSEGASGDADVAAAKPTIYVPRTRIARFMTTAVAIFVVWHIGCMLATGSKPIRDFLDPVIGWYVHGARMTNTWGMFGKPPRRMDIVVAVNLRDGSTVDLMSCYSHDKGWWERVRDARVRKLQGKLQKPVDQGVFGREYLDYFCREAQREYGKDQVTTVVLRLDHPDALDDDGNLKAAAKTEIVMRRMCAEPMSATPMPRPPRRVRGSEPDMEP